MLRRTRYLWLVLVVGLVGIGYLWSSTELSRTAGSKKSESPHRPSTSPHAPSPKQNLRPAPSVTSEVAHRDEDPSTLWVDLEDSNPSPRKRADDAIVTHSVSLDELRENCWEETSHDHATGTTPQSQDDVSHSAAYDGEFISYLSIRIPTSPHASTPFDFCIDSVQFGGVELVWESGGWVAEHDNPKLSVNGPWFVISDAHTTWDTPSGASGFSRPITARGPLCVTGTSARVIGNRYAEYWGAGMNLTLYQSSRTGPGGVYRPRFKDMSLSLTGSQIPRKLRIVLDTGETPNSPHREWCTQVVTTGSMISRQATPAAEP